MLPEYLDMFGGMRIQAERVLGGYSTQTRSTMSLGARSPLTAIVIVVMVLTLRSIIDLTLLMVGLEGITGIMVAA